MKKTRKVTEMTCDQCGHKKSDDGLLRFGGSVFSSWFHVTMTEITSIMPRPTEFGKKDFCSKRCVYCYFKTLVANEERPIANVSENGTLEDLRNNL